MPKVCTLIVGGYASVRAGLAALLRDAEGICLQGDAPDADDLLARMLPGLTPDAVVLETGRDGAASVERVLEAAGATAPAPAVVVLGDAPARDIPRLLAANALPGWAYLPRDTDAEALAAAVRAAAAGAIVLDRHIPFSVPATPAASEDDEPLTAREAEVLELMAQGLPNKTIAHRLGISVHTAKFHVAQILGKLGADSRTEAVTRGARRGLVTL